MTDVDVLDSEFPPTREEALQAFAGGIRAWGGYLNLPGYAAYGTMQGQEWETFGFDDVRSVGMRTIAFAFPGSDAIVAARVARTHGALLCLDDETDDARTDAWLAAARTVGPCGLYGLAGTIAHHSHSCDFYVVADYRNGVPDPRVSLGSNPPGGWQFRGSHTEYGVNVDRSRYDARIFGTMVPPIKGTMTAQEVASVVLLAYEMRGHVAVDVNDPVGFGHQVNAVLAGDADLHTVVNNVLHASPPAFPPHP